MEEPEKLVKEDIETKGDVTHTTFKPPTPIKPPHKPITANPWVGRTLWTVLLLALAGASFYGAWWVTGKEEPAKKNTNTMREAKTWEIAKAKAKVPRTEVAAALYQDKIYVIGGFNKDGQTQNTVELFDPGVGVWSDGPALPTAVHHASAATFDNGLYVVGGLTGSDFKATDKVYVFDGDAWLPGPALPEPLGAQGAAVLGDRLYIVGGNQHDSASTAKVYSLGKDDSEWRSEPAMPTARNHLTVAVVNDQLYAIGGRNDSSMTLQTVEIYDHATKKWRTAPDMLTGRSGLASTVLDNKIYVFGGESNDKTFREAEEYNPTTQSWRSITPMAEARHGLGAAAAAGQIYLTLGGPQPGLSVSDTVEILTFE